MIQYHEDPVRTLQAAARLNRRRSALCSKIVWERHEITNTKAQSSTTGSEERYHTFNPEEGSRTAAENNPIPST